MSEVRVLGGRVRLVGTEAALAEQIAVLRQRYTVRSVTRPEPTRLVEGEYLVHVRIDLPD